MDAVSSAFTAVGGMITTVFGVITTNPWLLVLVAAPVLLGLLGAIMAYFKH